MRRFGSGFFLEALFVFAGKVFLFHWKFFIFSILLSLLYLFVMTVARGQGRKKYFSWGLVFNGMPGTILDIILGSGVIKGLNEMKDLG